MAGNQERGRALTGYRGKEKLKKVGQRPRGGAGRGKKFSGN